MNLRSVIAGLAAGLVLGLSATAVAADSPAARSPAAISAGHLPGPVNSHCPAVTHTRRPMSLDQIQRWTGMTPSVTIYWIIQCDPYHGGYTFVLAKLLSGAYGADIFKATLPAGTQIWRALR